MKKLAGIILLAGLMTGCSTMSSIFGDKDNSELPAVLEKITDGVTLKKLWSDRVGVGYEEQFIKLVPAVSYQQVFVADRKGRVAAFDAETGKLNWEVKTDAVISAGPGVGEGLVLVGTSDAEVLALDAANGDLLWKARVSSEVLSVPRIDIGRVIVQAADGKITALAKSDGQQLWVYDRTVPVLTLRGTSSPAVEHGLVVAGFSNGKLAAISAEKGFALWESNIAIPSGRSELERMIDIDGDPVIVGNAVYVTTFQGRIAVVNLQNGEAGWKRDMSSYAGLGVDFSQVYVTDDMSHVWALSRNNGSSVWKQDQLQYRGLTAPVPFDQYVAVGDYQGYLHLLSRQDGRIVGRVQVDSKGISARPLVMNDTLYVYGNSGILAAYALPEG
ncbi:MAG: outer membrane protein assembly factor BamB [Gammaproteobacteria bacterium]